MTWLIVFSHNYFAFKYLKYQDNHSRQWRKSHDIVTCSLYEVQSFTGVKLFTVVITQCNPNSDKDPDLLFHQRTYQGPGLLDGRWWASRQESVQPLGSSILLSVLPTEGFHFVPLNHPSSSTDCYMGFCPLSPFPWAVTSNLFKREWRNGPSGSFLIII